MMPSLNLGTETPETLPDRLIPLGRTLLRVLLEEQVEAMAQTMMADPTYRITDQGKALDYFRANARSRLSAATTMVERTGYWWRLIGTGTASARRRVPTAQCPAPSVGRLRHTTITKSYQSSLVTLASDLDEHQQTEFSNG